MSGWRVLLATAIITFEGANEPFKLKLIGGDSPRQMELRQDAFGAR